MYSCGGTSIVFLVQIALLSAGQARAGCTTENGVTSVGLQHICVVTSARSAEPYIDSVTTVSRKQPSESHAYVRQLKHCNEQMDIPFMDYHSSWWAFA